MRKLCLVVGISLALAPAALAGTTTGGGSKAPCLSVHAGVHHTQNLFHPFNTHQTLGGGSGGAGGGGIGCPQGHGQAHSQAQNVKPVHLHHLASLGRRG